MGNSNSTSSCEASGDSGSQLKQCPESGELTLPLENFPACCQKENENCERVCPTIKYEGKELKYTLSNQVYLREDGGVLGIGAKKKYNCACTESETLKELKREYERWPQTIEAASAKLAEIEDFKSSVFEKAAMQTGHFPISGLVILDQEKWTQVLFDYNKLSDSAPLDIEKCIKLLDSDASAIDVQMVAIAGIAIFVIFVILIFMKKMSKSRNVSDPRWKQKADREIEMLKRNPQAARRVMEEEDDD